MPFEVLNLNVNIIRKLDNARVSLTAKISKRRIVQRGAAHRDIWKRREFTLDGSVTVISCITVIFARTTFS
jgi:hypothetical protein